MEASDAEIEEEILRPPKVYSLFIPQILLLQQRLRLYFLLIKSNVK